MAILATGLTATGVTQTRQIDGGGQQTYQATISGSGAISASVSIEVTNDDKQNWLTLGTISLSGTNVATDGFASFSQWSFVRANVTAISGTGAIVNVFIGL